MKEAKLSKIVLSIDVGKSGPKLINASKVLFIIYKVLKKICLQIPTFGQAKITVKSFGIRRGEFITTYCTLRNEKAMILLVIIFFISTKGSEIKISHLKSQTFQIVRILVFDTIYTTVLK